MTKWIPTLLTAAAIATAAAMRVATAPQNGCADQSRRAAAVGFARAINTAEAASFRGQRSYLQMGDLPVGTAPNGMTVQLSTDGETYAFSVKDDEDACHGAVFSDQTGVIYAGAPIQ